MENTNRPNQNNGNPVPRRPRRKKRSPLQIFVKHYLPLVAVVLVIVLFIIFAVGSVRRGNERREQARQESIAQEESLAQQQRDWEQEAAQLIAEADKYAASCDFDLAIEVLNQFSGNPYDFKNLTDKRTEYENGESTLVSVDNVTTIPCLSFGSLMADSSAFVGEKGENNRRSYISAQEFLAILQQMYDKGYMLVGLDDVFTTEKDENGATVMATQDLRLPAGKKPVILIHSGSCVNRLVVQYGGPLFGSETLEDHATTADFVPLLEEFIASHPGFSYKGARAILAVTGSKGLFGNELTDPTLGALVSALQDRGYTIASNTYGDVAYGKLKAEKLQEDIASWETSIEPILGNTQVLVYSRSSDISDSKQPYDSEKFDMLYEAGFRYYFGMCYTSSPWMTVAEDHVRIGRLVVNGNNLKTNATWFAPYFDSTTVLNVK
jgi:hypothetical protein